MIARAFSGASSNSWQLILADLALILFLLTLAALGSQASQPVTRNTPEPSHFASSQALFRQTRNGPSLKQWLTAQPRDRRATLTVFARHSGADSKELWQRAQVLASVASGEGYAVRVLIERGETSDLYASLAYDTPITQLSE